MEYRTLGNTRLRVSVLSYGASPLGGVFGGINEAAGIRTVHTALDLGINFVDVSPFYGITKAETVLGKALKGIPRDRYHLATKCGRYGMEEFDFSAARVTRGIDESLSRLGVDYVDLIQCHDIEFGDLDQVVNETIPALRKLRDRGKARFIGITGYPLRIFRYVLDRTQVDTVLTYCHYALNNTLLDGLIPYLQQKGVGIINASPLSMGLLAEKELPDWHPAPREMRQVVAKAKALCRACGVDLAQLAMQFALANADIATTLVGTANPANLKKNVEWIQSPPDPQLLRDVLEMLKPIHNQTWAT